MIAVGHGGIGPEGKRPGQKAAAMGHREKGVEQGLAEEIEVEKIVGSARAGIGQQAKTICRIAGCGKGPQGPGVAKDIATGASQLKSVLRGGSKPLEKERVKAPTRIGSHSVGDRAPGMQARAAGGRAAERSLEKNPLVIGGGQQVSHLPPRPIGIERFRRRARTAASRGTHQGRRR